MINDLYWYKEAGIFLISWYLPNLGEGEVTGVLTARRMCACVCVRARGRVCEGGAPKAIRSSSALVVVSRWHLTR